MIELDNLDVKILTHLQTPFFAAPVIPDIMDTDVEIARAQGQEITRRTRAL